MKAQEAFGAAQSVLQSCEQEAQGLAERLTALAEGCDGRVCASPGGERGALEELVAALTWARPACEGELWREAVLSARGCLVQRAKADGLLCKGVAELAAALREKPRGGRPPLAPGSRRRPGSRERSPSQERTGLPGRELFRRAEQLCAQRRFQDAIPLFEQVLRLLREAPEPLHEAQADVWAHLGVAMQSLDRMHEALASYGRAVALNPSLHACYANLAALHQHLGNAEVAARYVQRALSLCPDHPAYLEIQARIK